jgi:hypothetical protein
MENKVDQLRDSELMNVALEGLSKLLDTQVDSMGPLSSDKKRIARQGMTAVYLHLAKGLHAHEMGEFDEEHKHNLEAGEQLSEMRTKLEGPH